MLNSLTNVPLTPEKDSVGTSRGTESKLVKSEGLTTSGSDALPGSGRESKGGDGELGNLGETLVVENGANDDNGLGVVGVRVLGLLNDSRERNGGSVDLFTTTQPSFVLAIRQQPTLLINNLLRMTRLNLESVLLAKNR